MYLACAVIACAADLTEVNNKTVITKLHQDAGIPLEDLESLSSIITEIILNA